MAGGIFIIAEQRSGKIKPESYELVGFSEELAKGSGEERTGIILGFPVEGLAKEFAEKSGLKVIGLESPVLENYNGDAYLNALKPFLLERKPNYILILHTATGWDFAPRLAVAINGFCCTGIIRICSKDALSVFRPICNGKIYQEIKLPSDRTTVLTVMPGSAKPVFSSHIGEFEIHKIKIDKLPSQTLGYIEAKRQELGLNEAEIIVSVGRGIKGPEHLELVKKLVAVFEKAGLGASRPVVDAGWLGYEHQIGQTGQTVRPKIYLALGISGAVQHIIGMKDSELIIAINKDPNANIFKIAHLGVIQDLHQFLPILVEKIQLAKFSFQKK